MRYLATSLLLLIAVPASADTPRIDAAQLIGTTLRVTVSHADAGWDHYADGWRVFTPDGREIGYRKLLHPHDNEQPFTRSLSRLNIPDGVTELRIVPHDNVHGDGEAYILSLE